MRQTKYGARISRGTRLQNRKYCFPLTICDHYSRFFLGCTALENTRGYGARRAFIDAFERYGVPKVILTDNGSPFASCGLLGLTTLSAWWRGLSAPSIKAGFFAIGSPESARSCTSPLSQEPAETNKAPMPREMMSGQMLDILTSPIKPPKTQTDDPMPMRPIPIIRFAFTSTSCD